MAVVAPPFYEVPPSRYGGIERVCFTLVEGLVDRGHEVTLIAAGKRHTRARFAATLPFAPSEFVDDPVAVDVQHGLVAARVIRELRPDVVHDHTISGLLSAPAHPCPTLATVHSALDGPDSKADLYRAVGSTVPLASISDSQRRDAPDLNWTGLVYNGIALPTAVRRHTRRHVLYLGRINPLKGVEHAISAARAAARPLVLAGSGTTQSETEYMDRAIRPLLGDGVEWVGEVDDARKTRLLAQAGCLILPVHWHEPFGLVVAEALASGVPVVGMRMGALPELVQDGKTGVLCDEVHELPAAIERAFELDGTVCRKWATEQFDGRRMVTDYEQMYWSLVRHSRH